MPKRKGRVDQCLAIAATAGRKPTPLSTAQQQDLDQDGFTILDYVREGKNELSAAKRARFVEKMLDEGSFIVNNKADGTPGDYSRLMMEVKPTDVPGKLAMRVVRKLLRTFSYLRLGKATYLSSIDHGHDQLPHIDVSDPNEVLRSYVQKGMVPLSIMVTFREPAILNVWRGSHNLVWETERTGAGNKMFGERVVIPPYSAMIFRQDLVHSGTAYKSENLRVHTFLNLNVDDYEDDPGAIKLMDPLFFRMRVPN